MFLDKIKYLVVGLSFCLFSLSCAHRGTVEVLAGQTVPGQRFSIDVNCDETLNRLVPGYKIVTVAIHNEGLDSLILNPQKDVWKVVDGHGTYHTALAELNRSDPNTWQNLTPEVQAALSYSLVVPSGVSQAIDLFVPGLVDLTDLRTLFFQSFSLHRTIKVIRRL